MKKVLIALGVVGIGYALYNYFNKQLALALQFEYKIKGFKVLSIGKTKSDIQIVVSILNKSLFTLKVNSYNFDIYYSGEKIANANNNIPFVVEGDTWFDVPVVASIYYKETISVADDFVKNVLVNNPILLSYKGKINVTFQGITKEVDIDVKDIASSENFASDYGLTKPVSKINTLLGKLGVTI